MDVDLVPAFIFSNDKWPKGEGYRKNPIPNQKVLYNIRYATLLNTTY